MKPRVFSGIQPTGNIHIGNYLGAIRQWVASQDETDNFFCIVNLHAITIPQDPLSLNAKTRELAGLLLAAGIDPQRSILFVQSQVSAHAELAWILDCMTPMGWMERMHQYKEKSAGQKERVSVGLFSYPALMAADILLYDADRVPVGEDQKQHVELARDVAQRFNSLYGVTFKLPEPIVPSAGGRVMGLDDPTKKMSKSDNAPNHAIALLDPPDEIRRKIARATTDSLSVIRFDEARPGLYNLLVIYERFSGLSRAEIEQHFTGQGYAALKRELAEVISAGLQPLQLRYKEIMADSAGLERLLVDGAEKARPLAQKKLREVKDKLGLG